MICSIDLRTDDNFKECYKDRLNEHVDEALGIDTILFDSDKVDVKLLMVQLKSFFGSEEFKQNRFRMVKEIFGDNIIFCNYKTFKQISKLIVEDLSDKESNHFVNDFSCGLNPEWKIQCKLDVDGIKRNMFLKEMA